MNEVQKHIETHIPQLRRYARALTRNPVAADDLLQESVLRALTKAHLFRAGTNLRAWLFTILHNQHVSTVRWEGRHARSTEEPDEISRLSTPPSQEHHLMARIMDKALHQLPDQQRVLIELAALRGESYDAIAAKTGLAIGTVKSRISRGRARLLRLMDGDANDNLEPARPIRLAVADRRRRR